MDKKYVVISCENNQHQFAIGTVVTIEEDGGVWNRPTFVATDENGFSQLLEECEIVVLSKVKWDHEKDAIDVVDANDTHQTVFVDDLEEILS